ncbi:hypothetical protein KFZ70_14285 [Tamlana fucoidanivorans]|uniref:DUF4136 domain-containing protein n=1 Tax=Allotamlana fucoidanivorans TaxID=2583814 RepID=A0A5C4SQM3_9FLAO|nr:hypothetical protein [Tamlana fucoidanivorans]TNJ46596.1 hypothetical protein FGF67_02895 [Tamlana fucoidanivorans]
MTKTLPVFSMQLNTIKVALFSLIISLSSCSGLKVLNTYTADHVATIKDQKVLVIARMKKQNVRESVEREMTKQLLSSHLKASESYKVFPKLKTNETLSKEDLEKFKLQLKEQGFDAVCISSVIGVERLSKTNVSGGYEAGADLGSYYGMNTIGFFGYYTSPVPTPTFKGVYEPVELMTETAQIYVLETAVYNLDLPENKQMIASVTSKIENVETAGNIAKKYAKAVVKSLKK